MFSHSKCHFEKNVESGQRILVLTGPAGTAKTATVRVLAQELGFELLEWRNSIGDTFAAFDSKHFNRRVYLHLT